MLVAEAVRAREGAERLLRDLEDRVRGGDEGVTAAALADARAGVEWAGLRVEAARQAEGAAEADARRTWLRDYGRSVCEMPGSEVRQRVATARAALADALAAVVAHNETVRGVVTALRGFGAEQLVGDGPYGEDTVGYRWHGGGSALVVAGGHELRNCPQPEGLAVRLVWEVLQSLGLPWTDDPHRHGPVDVQVARLVRGGDRGE